MSNLYRRSRIVGQSEPTQWFQYTFLDEYSRFRYIEAFQEHNTYSSTLFLKHVVKKFPYAIECVQTDNGSEFTNVCYHEVVINLPYLNWN